MAGSESPLGLGSSEVHLQGVFDQVLSIAFGKAEILAPSDRECDKARNRPNSDQAVKDLVRGGSISMSRVRTALAHSFCCPSGLWW